MQAQFFANGKASGYPDDEVKEGVAAGLSFASFSFAKGHSASYAVESYQSLYLKAHHPLEFLVGVANNFGGFYHTEFYLHEANVWVNRSAPCINTSEGLCSLHDKRIYLGLGNVKSLGNGDRATTCMSAASMAVY